MSVPDRHPNPDGRALGLLVIVPLVLLSLCFLGIWMSERWGPDDGDRFDQTIGLGFGIIALLIAAVQGVSLAVPRLGRWIHGARWPGRFEDPARKRLAVRVALLQMSGSMLFGFGFLLDAIPDSTGFPSPPLFASLVLRVAAIGCYLASSRLSMKL